MILTPNALLSSPSFLIFSNASSSNIIRKRIRCFLKCIPDQTFIFKITSVTYSSSWLLTLFHLHSSTRQESFLTCSEDNYRGSVSTSFQDPGPSMYIIQEARPPAIQITFIKLTFYSLCDPSCSNIQPFSKHGTSHRASELRPSLGGEGQVRDSLSHILNFHFFHWRVS